jgi:hypothetical protein
LYEKAARLMAVLISSPESEQYRIRDAEENEAD